jgi:predicted Rossmann fold nucleotide-binding protein DprA/Smf involved in DNA uptake
MTSRHKILADLLTSPSTAGAITDHTGIPTEKVTSILLEEEGAGLVQSSPLKMLTVWSLTTEGHDIAKTLPAIPKQY